MAKRKNNRDNSNTYYTDKQKDKELDKLRRELIKPKTNYHKPKNDGRKFVKKQK